MRRWLPLALMCLLAALPAGATSVAKKKQIAQTAFAQAERLREAFQGRPAAQRSRADYQRVIEAYRKVYYVAPTSNRADDGVAAVAELLAEQGRAFDDEELSRAAIGQYEFLRREYPGSSLRAAALIAIAQIYADDLGDSVQARQTYQEFLKSYPRSELAGAARTALRELSGDAEKPKSAKAAKPTPKPVERSISDEAPAAPAAKASDKPDLRAELPPAIRVLAEKADAVAEGKAPRGSPVKIVPAPSSEGAESELGPRKKLPLVTGIRHWSTPDYTRIAVDLEQEVTYDVGRVPDPDRLFFDLHATKLASGLMGKEYSIDDGLLKKVRVAQFQPGETRIVLDLGEIADYQAFLLPNPYRLIVDVHAKKAAQSAKAPAAAAVKTASAPEMAKSAATEPTLRAEKKPDSAATPLRTTITVDAEPLPGAETASPEAAKKRPETVASAGASPAAKKPAKKTAKAGPARPVAREAQPTSTGDRSLIRALGLKIGRIVVDAGHGGHDTGTIGPTGLLEKDLVLDVAQRLGKLLEARLGAEVVYTREDDTFIPLETRTAVANREEADLFISVHANSSRDASARGVETYYLNFTSSAEALEVAARENAVSDTSIHELQDLVKKIALKEKIEESREFAADVQQALRTGLSGRGSSMRDRGVKKAPFIVLIGANMPSILAEISFLSNPADERRLKTPAHRQKIAESLYRGISRYVSGLSGVKVAASSAKASAP